MKYTGKYSTDVKKYKRRSLTILIVGAALIVFFIVFSKWSFTVLNTEYSFGFIPNEWAMIGSLAVWFTMLVLFLWNSVKVFNILNVECDPERFLTVYEYASLKKPNEKRPAVMRAKMNAMLGLGRMKEAETLASALFPTALSMEGRFILAVTAFYNKNGEAFDFHYHSFVKLYNALGRATKKHALKHEILLMLYETSEGRTQEALAHAKKIKPKPYVSYDFVFCAWIKAHACLALGKNIDAIGFFKIASDYGGKTFFKEDADRILCAYETGAARIQDGLVDKSAPM